MRASAAKELTRPCASVATDQATSRNGYSTRTLTISTAIPPGICNTEYVQAKAENMYPIWTALSDNSSDIAAAATEMLVRSM